MNPLTYRDPPPDDYRCEMCGELYPYCECETPSATRGEVLEQAGREDATNILHRP